MTTTKTAFDEARRDANWLERVDLDVAEAAEPWGDHPLVEAIGKASDLADQPPLLAASLVTLGVGLAGGDRRLARTGGRMLAAFALATAVKTLVKDHVDRPRPEKVAREGEHEVEPGDSEDGEERSLPSGHSAGAFAVARAVAREYPAASVPAHLIAGSAALVQIPRKAHFPTDVLLGTLIGIGAEAVVGAILPAQERD